MENTESFRKVFQLLVDKKDKSKLVLAMMILLVHYNEIGSF